VILAEKQYRLLPSLSMTWDLVQQLEFNVVFSVAVKALDFQSPFATTTVDNAMR
jgi:hypothetical protein